MTAAATSCQGGKDHHLYLAYASIFKNKGEGGREREHDLFTVIVVKTYKKCLKIAKYTFTAEGTEPPPPQNYSHTHRPIGSKRMEVPPD